MKILKIFGIVVGIHVFALILIFANPGCSSTTKPAPAPSDTVAKTDAAPPISVSTAPSSNYVSGASSNPSPLAPAPINFNPDAPATAAAPGSSGSGVRFTPTRPGTPVAGVLVAEPLPPVQDATTYVVKSGDSLWSIAKKNHLTVPELAGANGIAAGANLKPGQKLLIPGKSPTPAASATVKGPAPAKSGETTPTTASAAKARSGDGAVKHVVKSGETLGGIAKMYEVKASDIAVANSISDPAKIRAGMELIIPGWQTPGSKAGKSSSKKSAEPKSAPAVEAPPQPAPPPQIPVIRLDDSPVTPAPKP